MSDLRKVLSKFVVGSVALGAAGLLTGVGCGSDTIYGSGTGPTIDVRGNIVDMLPAGTDRDIIVFVFTTKDPQVDCEIPQMPPDDDRTQFQSRRLRPGDTEFEVRNAKAGHITVVFLLDGEGNDADQTIDPGDPVAVLNDPDCVMDDVPNRYIVFAEDIEVNFGPTSPGGFPAAGRAEAADLYEEHEISAN